MTAAALALLLVAVAASSRAAEPVAAIPDAAEDYALHCSACHRLDGTGTPGVVPSLHGAGALLVTPEGRRYLARVPGVAQAPLSDARLARLLGWVLLSFSGVSPEPPYAADEVGALRASPLRDPLAARRALGAASER